MYNISVVGYRIGKPMFSAISRNLGNQLKCTASCS